MSSSAARSRARAPAAGRRGTADRSAGRDSRGSSRAEPDWRCSHSVSPPLERTRRACSRGRRPRRSAKAPPVRERRSHTTAARALSHAPRRRLGARAVKLKNGIGLVRSAGSRRRPTHPQMAVIQPRRVQKPRMTQRPDVTVRVAGADPPHASTAARSNSRTGDPSSGRSAPSARCRRPSVCE